MNERLTSAMSIALAFANMIAPSVAAPQNEPSPTTDSTVASPVRPSVKAPMPMVFCLVGDVNNPPDEVTGSGSVGYPFELGKYEVTNAQYCEFLNAVAIRIDPHRLFNINMEQGFLGGIRCLKNGEQYHYEPIEGYADLPVNYVTWYDAARFCNWLHYDKPSTGKQQLGTTEGNEQLGAYDTRDFDSDPRGRQGVQKHNHGARYWIPTLDEWNKAAYYDPTKDGKGGYWLYPTRSNTKPKAVPPGDTVNTANYYDHKWAARDPFLTPVGGYQKAASYYGTFDQAGNVWEWIETLRPSSHGRQRWVRGGACTSYANTLIRTDTDGEYGDHRLYCFGLRVCRQADSPPKSWP